MIKGKKIKICEMDGMKLDSVFVNSEEDMKEVIKRWKQKGFF